MNRNLLRDAPAWMMSLVVNLTALGALHFVVLYKPVAINEQIIDSTVDTEETTADEMYDNVYIADASGQRGEGDPTRMGNGGGGAGTAAFSSAVNANPNIAKQASSMGAAADASAMVIGLESTDLVSLPSDINAVSGIVAAGSKGSVDSIKGGTPGIMDRLTFEIEQSCKERPTLVLWVFDASGSLKERRDAIADRFDIVYEQLGKQTKEGILFTAAMHFGEKYAFMTDEPVTDTKELVAAVKKIPEDKSGVENVFAAVHAGVNKYKNFGKGQGKYNKMVIIITDERGDDPVVRDASGKVKSTGPLEQVIAEAKKSQFRVNCVGNSAVFGREKGYVNYTYEDGFEEMIDVDQGPETFFPELVQLPMWSDGGQFRRTSASFGPYALTRLCAETSGVYLVSDDAKGETFDRAIMRNYTPDYRPVDKQMQDIAANAAKAGLVQLAESTFGKDGRAVDIPTPQMVFRGYTDNLIRNECTEAQKPMAAINYLIDPLVKRMNDLEKSRALLKEPRWQASFDLAAGRIYAMYARTKGYQLMLANMKTTPKTYEKPDSNMWRIVQSPNVETGPEIKKTAEKARMYLKRVVDLHAGTPWAAMASRELSDDFGWTWEEFHTDLPGGMDGPVRDEDVPRLLLAEEEQRMEMQKRGPAPKQRDRPKL
jgi:hypothetical protein